MSTDHIITNTKTGRLVCQHCKVEETPPHMPCPINIIIDAMDYFESVHKDCKPPMPETVMSEYIKGFDAGYGYVLNEIERWQEEVGQDLHVLLERLRMETTKGRETT